MSAFQADGPGSIPGWRIFFFFEFFFFFFFEFFQKTDLREFSGSDKLYLGNFVGPDSLQGDEQLYVCIVEKEKQPRRDDMSLFSFLLVAFFFLF